MNRNDDILNFLVEGLIAPQRDLVTRAFYKFAEGDPDSAPVNEAILLTACARRLSLAPRELREASAEFGKLLADGREMEARIRERVELSNFGVVSEFKDETRRATDALREIVSAGNATVDRGKRIDEKLSPIASNLERIGVDLYLLKDELKGNRDSAQHISEEAKLIRSMHEENQAFFKAQGKEARANWLTTGFVGGMPMVAVSFHLPWWQGLMLLASTVGMIQWFSRLSWSCLRRLWQKEKPT
jgi:hypothetical protein